MPPFAIFFSNFPWGRPPGPPTVRHELGKIHSLPVSEKLCKSVPLALCVHMFITLATPLMMMRGGTIRPVSGLYRIQQNIFIFVKGTPWDETFLMLSIL